jgi:hypothetical protein
MRYDGSNHCSTDEAQGSQNDQPLCSVLCCVIDNVMVPPTPLEQEEHRESTQNGPIMVPVLRVFGPIIRGDAPSGADPVQSACLYIHGAFPYMLARPAAAGPDGSLHRSSHLRNASGEHLTNSGHVDWDNPSAIKNIAKPIQENLESALQAMVVNKDSSETTKVQERAPKFIRAVTVVMGRGFYTYCPGPPAPFLRVEYYDPKTRWKVKLLLERGLELPHVCHPDPQQYDAVGNVQDQDGSQLGRDPLSFHCYEAHIPHTMQFFKDWNLAGKATTELLLHAVGKKRNSRGSSFVAPRALNRCLLHSRVAGKLSTASTLECPPSLGDRREDRGCCF